MVANIARNRDSPLVSVDQSHGRYPDLALIRRGKMSANGDLIVRVERRIDPTHGADRTAFDEFPALPLAGAKKQLEELAATGKEGRGKRHEHVFN